MVNIKSRIEESLNFQSKYCYPGTDVLINKLNIKNQEDLDVAERRITILMLTTMELREVPSPDKLFSVNYYLGLHKELFGEIYSFAGEIRGENMTKNNTVFCRPENIYYYLKDTLLKMSKDLPRLENKDDMVDWLAYYYGELNAIHPFREGNGRVSREFLREVVECADKYLGFNYELNFSGITNEDSIYFNQASIINNLTGSTQELSQFFQKILKEKQEKQKQEKTGK